MTGLWRCYGQAIHVAPSSLKAKTERETQSIMNFNCLQGEKKNHSSTGKTHSLFALSSNFSPSIGKYEYYRTKTLCQLSLFLKNAPKGTEVYIQLAAQ